MKGFCLVVLVLLFSSLVNYSKATSNVDSIDRAPNHNLSVKVTPLVFYRPETKIGVGLAGNISFKISKQDTTIQASNITVLASYTQLKQKMLLIPFKLIFPKRTWYCEGEADYTNFLFSYWGNGNSTLKEEFYKENYSRLVFSVIRKMPYNFYTGIKFCYENHFFLSVDSGKNAILYNSPAIIGRNGGMYSGIGYHLTYDTRDNIYYPYKGTLLTATSLYYTPILGSTANYSRYTFDATKYLSIKPKQILVLDVIFDHTTGEVPFTQMAVIGGASKLRGYYEGRYRDKNLLNFAAEYRFKVWRRFGAVVFANYGKVAQRMKEVLQVKYYRYTIGSGLRFMINPQDRLNIRFDAGFGKQTQAFYLTIGEAL